MTDQLDFFNTIHLQGEELKQTKETCSKQESRILEIFDKGGELTPFQVEIVYNLLYDQTPITSIRRAITCLTKKGYLEKLEEMKSEKYGKPNHKWRVKR